MTTEMTAHSSSTHTHHTEVLVLGAGPGGYVAAIRAAQLGKQVTVVEDRYWGGVCLNVGCIPSKALLHNAELAHTVMHRAEEFGIFADNVGMDYGVAHQRSRDVSARIVKGIHYLMRKNNITEVHGRGAFLDSHTLQVEPSPDASRNAEDAAPSTVTYTFDQCIIATGAHAAGLPNTEFGGPVVSFEEHILNPELPHSMVIVGAGPIGMEFAYVLANYGVRVTIVEYAERLLPNEDAEVSAELLRHYRKLGVIVRKASKVESVTPTGDGVEVSISPVPDADGSLAEDATPEILYAERCLISTGFRPNVTGYGLENTGVELTDQGAIAVDEVMRTSVPHIYAVGDVTAKLQLAHVAEAQGVIAAETIAGVETDPIEDYRMMPRATFCNPQVASFGLTEEQAEQLLEDDPAVDLTVSKFPFSANGKALGLGEGVGFVKLITDGRYGELLGAHIVGPHASELLAEYVLAQKWELTAEEIGRTVHIHPTLSEALKEGADGAMGSMINL